MLILPIVQVLATLAVFPSPLTAQSTTTACNNSPSLCDRTYNNITFLGAHDSPFLRDETTGFSTSGNQFYNSTVQLSAGVRLLTAQVHKTNNSDTGATEWHLCHSSCVLLDAGKLSTWLTEIKTWMDGNPNEVVTILLVNSDGALASDFAGEFDASGIVKYSYKPSNSSTPASWPTLGSMIAANTRLVTFVASLSDNTGAPYLLDEFNYIFENNFDNSSPSDFSCNPNRPSELSNNPTAAVQSNRMFLMNHFLYSKQAFGIEIPDINNINTTNAIGGATFSLGTRMTVCAALYGKQPNFVIVDFFNVGPAIASVDRANGVTMIVQGRKSVSTSQLTQANGASILTIRKETLFIAVMGGLVACLTLF
jgi:hypothetical protein